MPQSYTVVQGDTLSSIAARYHTTTLALMRANGIVNANRVFVGTILLIPPDGVVESAPATTSEAVAPALSPTPTPAETEQVATPAETPLPATATALPSIGFEIGGEIFGFDHLDALHQAEMNWAKVSIHWNTGDPTDAAKNRHRAGPRQPSQNAARNQRRCAGIPRRPSGLHAAVRRLSRSGRRLRARRD